MMYDIKYCFQCSRLGWLAVVIGIVTGSMIVGALEARYTIPPVGCDYRNLTKT